MKETAYPVGKSAQNGPKMCVSKGKKLLEIVTMDLDGSMKPALELSTRTAAIFKTLCNSSGQTSTEGLSRNFTQKNIETLHVFGNLNSLTCFDLGI